MKTSVLAIALGLVLCGCATITGSPTQTVSIGSTPSEARIVVTDEADAGVFAGLTPATCGSPG